MPKYPTIEKCNLKYGAPMGRREYMDSEPASNTVRVFNVPIDSQGYDPGGAYWGSGQKLYCATDGTDKDNYRAFTRADSRAQAIRLLKIPAAWLVKGDGDKSDIREFTAAYSVAALWSSTDDDGEPLDGEKHADRRFSTATRKRMEEDCRAFFTANRGDIGDNVEQAGHDFWLTRNRHGVGFWDRPEVYGTEASERLTKASEAFGECDLYISDRGLFCI